MEQDESGRSTLAVGRPRRSADITFVSPSSLMRDESSPLPVGRGRPEPPLPSNPAVHHRHAPGSAPAPAAGEPRGETRNPAGAGQRASMGL